LPHYLLKATGSGNFHSPSNISGWGGKVSPYNSTQA